MTHRGTEENSSLVEALNTHLAITIRRLHKSGPTHYAVSRFDAIVFVWRSLMVNADGEMVARAESLISEFDVLLAAYPEFDAIQFPRSERTRHRTEFLIDQILESVGLRRRGFSADMDLYVGRELWQAAQKEEDTTEFARDESESIPLSGYFGLKSGAPLSREEF